MNRTPEEELNLSIDALNQEQAPPAGENPENGELLAAARAVRQLREPAPPDEQFSHNLARTLAARNRPVYRYYPAVATAGILFLIALTVGTGFLNRGPVYAMEKAVARLQNYHGILTMQTQNAAGEEWMVRQAEIWTEGDRYAVRQDSGVVTAMVGLLQAPPGTPLYERLRQAGRLHHLPFFQEPVFHKQFRAYQQRVEGEGRRAVIGGVMRAADRRVQRQQLPHPLSALFEEIDKAVGLRPQITDPEAGGQAEVAASPMVVAMKSSGATPC